MSAIHTGAGTNYVVQANNGHRYWVYCERSTGDLFYSKSTDDGVTWSRPIAIALSITTQAIAVWYDRWSGVAADKIHIAYTEASSHDILYNSIDTASSDALGSPVAVFAGASVAGGGALSIVKGRDGRLVVAGSIDAGAEDGAWSSTDNGATWGDTIADPSEAGGTDQYFLLPGWNADTADVQLIFWDASANELSVKRYDDSANTWNETLISASMVDGLPSGAFAHCAVVCDYANSRNVVIAWSEVDAANADLRCWIIDDTTITEVTNVVQNSTDDQGLAALAIDTASGTWYAFYAGKSDGSETWASSLGLYYKTSTDSGTTWSAEATLASELLATAGLFCCPRFTDGPTVVRFGNNSLEVSLYTVTEPTAGGAGGVSIINRRTNTLSLR